MFSPYPHRDSCDRARQLASRDLDGDLSELDVRALNAHMRECPDCAAFAEAMAQVTGRVRGSERIERVPAAPAVVAARRRGRSGRRLLTAMAVTAATAAAAGAGALVASHASESGDRSAHTQTIAELAPLDHQFRVIREGKLLLTLPPQRPRSPHGRGVLV